MMMKRVKDRIYQEPEELFALAAADEPAGDAQGHREKLETIARVCDIPGIETEIGCVTINLKE